MLVKKYPLNGYVEPGRIFGNVYFVGTHPASVHLIDTGDGLMLIDTGYLDTLYMVVHNIWSLGFQLKDIKYILLSHGHGDHVNGAKALVDMTGAKTFLGVDDLPMVRGELSYTKALYPFEPDVLLHDGDTVTLGNTTVTCISTPGHTDGTISFFFNATDGERTLRVGMFGGAGLNTLNRAYFERTGVPESNRDKYFASLERLKKEKVEVFIGNHVGNNDTEGRLAAVRAGNKDAFVDSEIWGEFLCKMEKQLRDMMKEEAENA